MRKIWNFPLASFGGALGLDGTGIDQFRTNQYENLAREIIQNSLDARNPNSQERVTVEFHTFETTPDKFVGAIDFYQNLIKCKEYVSSQNQSNSSDKERSFVDRALSTLNPNNTSLYWLRISDTNTTGLTGFNDPENQDTPYFAFIKGTGKNSKQQLSGGSRGLGKNAIYANSFLQTILVSTLTADKEFASIGVAKLLSIKAVPTDGGFADYTQGIGFCVDGDNPDAIKYNLPSPELYYIDPEYNRTDSGTDIYVPGFIHAENWDQKLLGEAIISFMPAIINDDLEIKISCTNNNIEKLINKTTIEHDAVNLDNFSSTRQRTEAKNIYNAITKGRKFDNYLSCEEGCEMSMYLYQDEVNAENQLYAYRFPTKMRIERRGINNSSIPVTGVLYIEGEKLAGMLRGVEDATHSRWVKSRWNETSYTKEEISNAIDMVNNFITDNVETMDSASIDDESDIDLLRNDWGSDEDADTMDAKLEKDIGLPSEEVRLLSREDPVINKRRRKPRKKKATEPDEDGEASNYFEGKGTEDPEGDDVLSHPEGNNNGHHVNPHPGSEDVLGEETDDGNATMIRRPVSVLNCKMPAIDPENGKHRLLFTPRRNGENVVIEILKSGIGGENEPVTIKSATINVDGAEIVEINENKIYLSSIRKNNNYAIDIELDEKENYYWEVNLDAE